ncbi:S28 family serine protease [Saccharopolyspora sp. 6V]|uniref:S28 family serine protease n=1 Tax=Saccharopolyspora sp. 6V TaxID=2877239 RepID=UPI001CD7972C|nr:S28 family serine protease [Saccharopolyspora sp. 6V]MCA1194049.1 aminopeptidase [Saccharopolyspora sp. 6V]
MRIRGWLSVLAAGCVLLAGTPIAAAEPAADELRGRLEAVPGLTVLGERPTEPGFRLFDLTYAQPADHRDPAAGEFQQRLTLLHRDLARPTVLYTTGYNLPAQASRTEPTRLLDGNQVAMEHRFFTPSRPDQPDWTDLNIWQAATDEHRVIEALRAVYADRWVTTGASKGGMTAVYHRRFYPEDVDATIAYVAPNDVVNEHDRYDEFLANVGDESCRAALTAVQRDALTRRTELRDRYAATAAAGGFTFDRIMGDVDRALEAVVVDAPFAFWQYRGQQDCAQIPAPGASLDDLWEFFGVTSDFFSYTDQGLDPYVPYYYQAGTQLGWPDVSDEPLADLLHNRSIGEPRNFVPREIDMRFRPGAMADVAAWVASQGSELMFVNGEADPWSAEPFQLGPGSRDSYSYLVPGGNHGSKIEGLPPQQRAEAAATVRRWAGVDQQPAQVRTALDRAADVPRTPPMLP